MYKNIGITASALGGSYFLYLQYQNFKLKQIPLTEKKNVVLVGYGYAGRNFYTNLDKSKYNIKVILGGIPTVIQPNFLDSLDTNNRSYAVHKLDKHNQDLLIYDQICEINTQDKIVSTTVDDEVNEYKYDYLVMAIGHEVNTFGVEGVDKYCKFYTTYEDLEEIRSISNVRKLKIAVIGASLAGLEVAGYLSDNHDIDVVEYANTILPMMKQKTREDVYELLRNKHNINFKLGTRLLKVEKNVATNKKIIYTNVGEITDVSEYDVVIWTAGVKPNSNMDRLLGTNIVDNSLCLNGKQNIFAIGDCNNLKTKSGQCAKSQGKYLANLFNSDFNGEIKEYAFKSMGTVIKLPHCTYIENDYYSGFAPRFIHNIIHWLDL